MKRILLWVLLLALLLPMVPATPVQAAELDNSMRPEVRSAVSKVITDYAKSIYQESAAADAIMELGLHAIFRNGAFLNVYEGDSVVASLFNSNLFQAATIDGITDSILTMQKFCQPELCVWGGPHWHHYNDSFSYTGYLGTERDYRYRIGEISSCKDVYGSKTFSGTMNRNDYAMQLLVGGLSYQMVIRQGEARSGKVVYNIRMTIRENFDFDRNYSTAEKNGYDASLDRALVKLGQLLVRFVINPFEWEFVKEFQVEVPYPCDHQMGGYSWELDPESMALRSITDGFLVNPAKTLSYVNENNGKLQYYYRLEKPIQLNHDKPWVVEYEGQKIYSLTLTPSYGSHMCMPFLRQYGSSYIWAQQFEFIPLVMGPDNNYVQEYTYAYHYRAATMQNQYKPSGKHTYTYRIENVPAGNGSNMIYVSVYDNDLGQQVLPPTPMNDYMTLNKGDTDRTLISEDNNGVRGIDFVINYIGSKSYYLNTGSLKLSIWENGEDVTSCDNVTTVYKAPTCTEDGGLFHTCRECGYGYVTNVEKALGHRYGTYSSDGNAGCEKDGTKTATCTVCGYKDTVTDPGTATGHNVIHQSAVDATCDTPGLTAGSYCDRCYTVYEEQVTIPAPGHDWQEATCETPKTCNTCGAVEGEPTAHQEVTVPGYAATCLEDGLTEGIVCGDCGLVILPQEEIPATENVHSWQNADCETPKTCSICGATEGEALGHTESVISGIAATCTENGMTDGSVCLVCGKVLVEQALIPATGHDWQEATCEEPQTCSICGATEGEAHAHTEVTVPGIPATCTESGLTDGAICEICETVTLPQLVISALGHSWQEATCENPRTCSTCFVTEGQPLAHTEIPVSGYDATCTKDGLTDGTQCSVCNTILLAQQVIPATGHDWQEATCTEPEICRICSATQGEAGNHNVVIDKEKAPTCTNIGLTEGSHCADCGQVLTPQAEVPALGHDWQEATCTSPDICTRCGSTSGTALGHDPVTEPGKDATCTEEGLTSGSHCAECGQVLTEQQVIAAYGHDWQEATCTAPETCGKCGATQGERKPHNPAIDEEKAPTCTETGLAEGSHCADCGQVLTEQKVLPPYGHIWEEATCTSPKTCTRCSSTTGEPLSHNPVASERKNATCTEDGLTGGKHCADCGQILEEQKIIEASGHKWKKATCTEPETCRKCGATQGEALGHDPVTKEGKEPTCTRAGKTSSSYCSDCRDVLTEAETIPATGHTDENNDGVCDVCKARVKKKPTSSQESSSGATEAATEAATEPAGNALLTSPQAPAPEMETATQSATVTEPRTEAGAEAAPEQESTPTDSTPFPGIPALLCLCAAILLWFLWSKKRKS